jgi:hypothetical protein
MIEIRCRICAAPPGPTGIPVTAAEPAVGEISVARIRIVVVLPAPLRIMSRLTSGTGNPTSREAMHVKARVGRLLQARQGHAIHRHHAPRTCDPGYAR